MITPIVMSEPAWITRWQAREALKNGRPEEAHRLFDSLVGAGNRRAWALRPDVVRGYVERAEQSLRRDDVESAWNDLRKAETLLPNDAGVSRLRETLTRLGLTTARALLENGKPLVAIESLAQLKERPAHSPEIALLEETARNWLNGLDMAERGEFEAARVSLEQVRPRLGGHTAGLDRAEQKLDHREQRFRTASDKMREALQSRQWRDVLNCADEMLAAAPRHREAQEARTQAWENVRGETGFVTAKVVRETPRTSITKAESLAAVPEPGATQELSSTTDAPLPKRFFLWIDGVGAYLVCLGTRITLGQATTDAPIDVPLFADLHRIHASLTRDEERYVLESTRGVQVNGRPIERVVLQTGDLLSLSTTCELAFDVPVPGCASARLRLTHGRRLPMAVDGVLLMSDMLVLGPGENVHVRIPELKQPVYVFRQKDRLGVRWPGDFWLDGEPQKDRVLLPNQGAVSGGDFAFAIEPVPK